eukprot:750063-Amphidinium_carterae.1
MELSLRSISGRSTSDKSTFSRDSVLGPACNCQLGAGTCTWKKRKETNFVVGSPSSTRRHFQTTAEFKI